MYNRNSFFNIEILKEVLSDYQWPAEYTLEEVEAGNVLLHFPKCKILFSEGFDSKMNAYFLNSEIGREEWKGSLKIFDAVRILKPIKEKEPGFKQPTGLIRFLDEVPSEQKVRDGLNNIIILLQAYLLSCIQGDFSWLDKINK